MSFQGFHFSIFLEVYGQSNSILQTFLIKNAENFLFVTRKLQRFWAI